MTLQHLSGNHHLLRIYVRYSDRFQWSDLAHYLLKEAREGGLAGGTILQDIWGFGAHRVVHTERAFEGTGDPDYVLEIVDRADKIREFVLAHQESLRNALVTEEDVTVHHYSAAARTETNQNAKEVPVEARMAPTQLTGPQSLLRIFVGESDRSGHHALHSEILTRARKKALAGCTILRGIAGFGASSVIHEPHLFKLSSDLPIIIEIIDSRERVAEFLKEVEPLLTGALVTEEEIHVQHYSSVPKKK